MTRTSTRPGTRLASLVASLVLLTAGPAPATTVTIINLDGAGEGLNDPTARAPEGGNPGTTLGDLRLNAFQEAADRWAAVLDSSVVIEVEGRFDPLFCSGSAALIGTAAATSRARRSPIPTSSRPPPTASPGST
jgi:hypothetical protein